MSAKAVSYPNSLATNAKNAVSIPWPARKTVALTVKPNVMSCAGIAVEILKLQYGMIIPERQKYVKNAIKPTAMGSAVKKSRILVVHKQQQSRI